MALARACRLEQHFRVGRHEGEDLSVRTPAPPVERPVAARRAWPAGVWVGIVLVVLIAVVAIGLLLRSGKDATPPNPMPPSTTADPQAAVKAAVLDAYRQSFDAFVAVASDPAGKPDDPRLEQHKVGNALLAAQATILRLRRDGHVYRGSVEVHPTIVELGLDTATVQDCGIDRTSTIDLRTGQVVSPPGTEGSAATATFRLIEGIWKQNEFKDERRRCVPPGA